MAENANYAGGHQDIGNKTRRRFDMDEIPIDNLPHKKFPTFFDDFDEDVKTFYFDVIDTGKTLICSDCKHQGTKHVMGSGGTDCKIQMCSERLKWVLEKIRQLIKSKFPSRELNALKSQRYRWPKYLSMDEKEDTKPQLLMSSERDKLVMIVHVEVKWETNLGQTNDEYVRKTVDKLIKNGFQVKYRPIPMGCRGVWCEKLYDFLSGELEMAETATLKEMETFSRELIRIPYNDYKTHRKAKDYRTHFE